MEPLPRCRERARLHGIVLRMRNNGRRPSHLRGLDTLAAVTIFRSIALFPAAAVLEIGGAWLVWLVWLVWQGTREHRGWAWIGAGVIALGAYGFVATLQADANFGRHIPFS